MIKTRVKLINKNGDTIWRAIMQIDLNKTKTPLTACHLDNICFVPMAGNVLLIEQDPEGRLNLDD